MTPGTVIFDGEELRWPLLHPSLAEKVRFFSASLEDLIHNFSGVVES